MKNLFLQIDDDQSEDEGKQNEKRDQTLQQDLIKDSKGE